MYRTVRGAAAAMFVTAAVLLLAGCAAAPSAPITEPVGSAPPSPGFEGVFAAEYLQVWNEADSDFVRSVIEDSQISEQEWSETEKRLSTCLSEAGIEFLGFDEEGGYSVNPGSIDGERANDILGECEKSSGEYLVGYLRTLAIINPENRDIDVAMTECLIRENLVDSSYTVEQYRNDSVNQTFPFIDPVNGPNDFSTCASDPLGVLSGG